MFTDLWQSTEKLWNQMPLWANLAIIFGVIAVVYGFLHFIGKEVRALFLFLNRERLHHRLKPYFSRGEIQGAIDNYIPTQCQSVDPETADSPARQKLIPFFTKKVFRGRRKEKYYLVLADSGMGKTTFMINLFFKHSGKWFKTRRIVLVPLGHPKADEKIEFVKKKPRTILLLDAFDEDSKTTNQNYKARMKEIIDKTLDFQTVIFTSHPQFFPSYPDIPQEIGLYKFDGDKGEHWFYRVYISPFSKRESHKYLRRMFPLYKWFKRYKARAIVAKSPVLMERPMLLANIHDLMEMRSNVWSMDLMEVRRNYQFTFEIYEEMVEQWIQRERVRDKTELRKFSEVIALDMYENQQARGGLFTPHDRMDQFAKKHGFRLEELELSSRSLLNRNSDGKYKFAHKSILEYLLPLEILLDPVSRARFNFDNRGKSRWVYYKQVVMPFFSRPLKGYFSLYSDRYKEIDIKKLDFKELDNIVKLNLNGNGITDLTPLRELRNLEHLDLFSNRISDITPLKKLKNIKWLVLAYNKITDIEPLRELTKIEHLHLSNNRITYIGPISGFENLEYLNLSDNRITDTWPIEHLENLTSIDLSFNRITELTSFLFLPRLKRLNVFSNRIDHEFHADDIIYLNRKKDLEWRR